MIDLKTIDDKLEKALHYLDGGFRGTLSTDAVAFAQDAVPMARVLLIEARERVRDAALQLCNGGK